MGRAAGARRSRAAAVLLPALAGLALAPPRDNDKAKAGRLRDTRAAVRAGRAFEVSDDVWMLAIGPTGANLVLDDIVKSLG